MYQCICKETFYDVFCFCKPYSLCILKNVPTFSALLHTRRWARLPGGPPRGYLQEIYSFQICHGRREAGGARGSRRGNAGWSPPQHPRCVPARLRRDPRRSQRIAAIVNRGRHRVTSGGPRLRYKILPRVTRCSPPEETRGFSRPAARYSIRRARGTIAQIMGSLCGGRGAWNLGGTRAKEISSLSSCAPFSEQELCAAI